MKGKGKGKCAGGEGCWAAQGQIGSCKGVFLEKREEGDGRQDSILTGIRFGLTILVYICILICADTNRNRLRYGFYDSIKTWRHRSYRDIEATQHKMTGIRRT